MVESVVMEKYWKTWLEFYIKRFTTLTCCWDPAQVCPCLSPAFGKIRLKNNTSLHLTSFSWMEALAIPSVLMATMPCTLVGWFMANLSIMLAPAPIRGQKYLTGPWSYTYRLRGRSPASPSDCRGQWRGWAQCPPWWGRCSPWEDPPPPVPGQEEPRAGREISYGSPPCGRRRRTPARSWRRPLPCGGSWKPRRRGAFPGPPGKDFINLYLEEDWFW